MPDITVIMHTNGGFPDFIEEAIYGVLQQTYTDYVLHLVNTHREPIRLEGTFEKTKQIHLPGATMKEQFIASLRSVETKYFCIVDADDFTKPDHLATLAAGMAQAQKRTHTGPLAVGTPFIIKSVGLIPRKLIRAGWVRFLFERIDPAKVPGLFEYHTKKCGLDQCVNNGINWQRWFLPESTKPTYYYRRNVAYHISTRVRRGYKLYQPEGSLRLLKPQIHFHQQSREIEADLVDSLERPPLEHEQSGGTPRKVLENIKNPAAGIRHFLTTRFNLGLYDRADIGSPGQWMNRRIELFSNYTLPSISNQTCENFTWLLVMDERTPRPHREIMARMSDRYKIIYSNLKNEPENVVHIIRSYILKDPAAADAAQILTTRIDNDDLMHYDFIKDLQETLPAQDFATITFLNGYVFRVSDKRLWERAYKYNQFPSMLEPADNKIKTVWATPHNGLKRFRCHKVITGAPRWCWVLHDSNLSGKARPPGKGCRWVSNFGQLDHRFLFS